MNDKALIIQQWGITHGIDMTDADLKVAFEDAQSTESIRADAAEAACAELRAALEEIAPKDLWEFFLTFPNGSNQDARTAIKALCSTTIGAGWHSPAEWEALRQKNAELDALADSRHDEIEALKEQLAAAQADTNRLDWLDKQTGAIDHQGYGDYSHYFGEPFKTIARAAIDAAQGGKA